MIIGRTQSNVFTYRFSYGRGDDPLITVPQFKLNQSLQPVTKNLPVFEYQNEILKKIQNNQVVILCGATGSGKTTQVPQYILNQAARKKEPCRIICTQPRRIATISVAGRVAQERNEEIGQSVGYQVRLESIISPTSNLIFTTSGFLLRCLMGQPMFSFAQSITHLIIDEVHERDISTDFLLITIHEALLYNPNIRVILMSATINIDLFLNYFEGAVSMEIPGRQYDVKHAFLEDFLPALNFNNKYGNVKRSDFEPKVVNETVKDITEEDSIFLDEILDSCWISYETDNYDQFIYMVTGEGVSINYKHRQTGMTALATAAAKGFPHYVKVLLDLGAKPNILAGKGKTALAWATEMNQLECVEILKRIEYVKSDNLSQSHNENYGKLLVAKYQSTINEERIDHMLLLDIIKYIHEKLSEGSILVFLPGFDDIIDQRDRVYQAMSDGSLKSNIEVFMLHSSLNSDDHKRVFYPATVGYRKLILATNIAETSITIDDVVYVVDTGKVKQKSFDAYTGSHHLATTWISRACAQQRSGRAGRTAKGFCLRMYTQNRFDEMVEFTIPEMLRSSLAEISLYSKLVAKDNISIENFLSKAIQPPSKISIANSIALLQSIGALDEKENITDLGIRLADLPVDVQLGKTLLYSILMKCLDPILTIVSILSVKDPFIIPCGRENKSDAAKRRMELSEDTFSDHLILLRVFQLWNEAKQQRRETEFCSKYFISNGSMEMIYAVRQNILGQLRALSLVRSNGNRKIQELNEMSNNWSVVKACLVAGLYPNVARIDLLSSNLRSKSDKKILFHSSSVLKSDPGKKLPKELIKKLPSEWIIYEQKVRLTSSVHAIKCNTVVSAQTIFLFGGPLYLDVSKITESSYDTSDSEEDDDLEDIVEKKTKSRSNYRTTALDTWIEFMAPADVTYNLYRIRQKLHYNFLQMIRNPVAYHTNNANDSIINTVAKILNSEDQENGFVQPLAIGSKPKSVFTYLSSRDSVNRKSPRIFSCVRDNQSTRSHHRGNHHRNDGHTSNFGCTNMNDPKPCKMVYNPQEIHPGVDVMGKNANTVLDQLSKLNISSGNKLESFFLIKSDSADKVKDSLQLDWKFNSSILNKMLDRQTVSDNNSIFVI